MAKFRTPNEVMNFVKRCLNNPEAHTRVKAGTWQANDDFKDHYMKVLFNSMFYFPATQNKEHLIETLDCDYKWAEEHFQERISGEPTNPGESYKRWPYKTFKEDDEFMDGKLFSHTYQERFWPKTAGQNYKEHEGIRYPYGDLNDVIVQLNLNPLTRQAYLPIFFPEDTGAVHGERVPCTLGYHFYFIGDRLHCNYIIRSCDIFRHFRNDMYLTSRLLQHIGDALQVEVGYVNFICFNLHLFENDAYPFKQREKRYEKNK